MKNLYFASCIVFILNTNQAFGAKGGMPQLNTEFWASQIFWLILIFSILYIIIWKIFLPKITDIIENRKSRIIGDLNETQKLKENAEKKLSEYNKIIEDTKKEAKKIIEDNKKKLENDIKSKKQKFNEELEKELMSVEREIKSLKTYRKLKFDSRNISHMKSPQDKCKFRYRYLPTTGWPHQVHR